MKTAWFFAGVALCRLENYLSALDCLKKAESLGGVTAATAELTGDCYYNLGRFDAARSSLQIALQRSPANNDVKSKLGLAEVRTGNYARGFRLMRDAIASEPSNAVLYDRSIQAAVWSGHLADASAVAEQKLDIDCAQQQDFLRAASIRAQCKQWHEAAGIVRRGLARFHESQPLLHALSELEGSIA